MGAAFFFFGRRVLLFCGCWFRSSVVDARCPATVGAQCRLGRSSALGGFVSIGVRKFVGQRSGPPIGDPFLSSFLSSFFEDTIWATKNSHFLGRKCCLHAPQNVQNRNSHCNLHYNRCLQFFSKCCLQKMTRQKNKK